MYRLLQYIEAQLHVYFTLPRFGGLPARFVDQKTIEIHKGTPQNLPHAYAIFHKHIFIIHNEYCSIFQMVSDPRSLPKLGGSGRFDSASFT